MYYDELYDYADANRNGQVSGQEAVKFLMLSGVPPPVLKVSVHTAQKSTTHHFRFDLVV